MHLHLCLYSNKQTNKSYITPWHVIHLRFSPKQNLWNVNKLYSTTFYSYLFNLYIYIPFPIRWLICMLSVFSALSPLRSIRRRTEQNGRTSDKCLLSSRRSSFSAIELMQANTYVDESCSIPWRGYLQASSHRSCKQVSVLTILGYKNTVTTSNLHPSATYCLFSILPLTPSNNGDRPLFIIIQDN